MKISCFLSARVLLIRCGLLLHLIGKSVLLPVRVFVHSVNSMNRPDENTRGAPTVMVLFLSVSSQYRNSLYLQA